MSEQDPTLNELISAVYSNQVTGYIFIATLAVVVYDGFLFFSQEVKCIWKRRFSTVTVLYVLIRYGIIFDMFMLVFGRFYMFTTIPSCKAFGIVNYSLDTICSFAIAVFACLRIWGITQHQWLPAMIVLALSIFDPAINLYIYLIPKSYTIVLSGPIVGCWGVPQAPIYKYLPVITRSISVTADAMVLIFTLIATWSIFRTGAEARAQTTLTSMLLKNGSLQFCILLLLNITAAVLDILSVAGDIGTASQNVSSFIYIQLVLNSILLAHFILDLRSIYPTGTNTSRPTGHITTSLQFATNIQGNLGATLDDSWATGDERDIDPEEDEKIQYADNPFAAGLLGPLAGAENGIGVGGL